MNAGGIRTLLQKLGVAVLLAALFIALPQRAHAQDASLAESNPWKLWLGAGAWFFEADDENEPGQLYEARLSYDVDPQVTVEAGLGYGPFFEGNDFGAPSTREATFNGKNSTGEIGMVKTNIGALYHLDADPDKVWDPYVSLMGGIGAFTKSWRDDGQMYPYGGPGLGVTYWSSKDLAFRLDYSALAAGRRNVDINHEVLAMVHFTFGGEEAGGENEAGANDLGARSSGPLKTIYFDFDKSNITPAASTTLQENANWIKANPGKHVSLEGHCDERGTNEYNIALGARRAKSAFDYLRSLGIPAEQMSTQSFGEEFPADPGHNEDAWSKNRRVESVVK